MPRAYTNATQSSALYVRTLLMPTCDAGMRLAGMACVCRTYTALHTRMPPRDRRRPATMIPSSSCSARPPADATARLSHPSLRASDDERRTEAPGLGSRKKLPRAWPRGSSSPTPIRRSDHTHGPTIFTAWLAGVRPASPPSGPPPPAQITCCDW